MTDNSAKIYIVMGVSASGKTTLGKALAKTLNLPFLDGDDYHPSANIKKMSSGIPLSDTDRDIWLKQLNTAAQSHVQKGAVIACSALKERYRETLTRGLPSQIIWIVLSGSYEVIQSRIAQRTDHFMPPGLLKSQFETLELPGYGIHLNVSHSVPEMLEFIKISLTNP